MTKSSKRKARKPCPIITTLTEIHSGKFTSATDKHGTGGTLVTVKNVLVLLTSPAEDGDTHVTVLFLHLGVPWFTTEITPVEKAKGVKDPPILRRIDITGYVYWDPEHVTELWHSYTGWEIHPIVSWK